MIRSGDSVIVVSGKHAGVTGKCISMEESFVRTNRCVVIREHNRQFGQVWFVPVANCVKDEKNV